MYKLSPDARNCEDSHRQIKAEREDISVKGKAELPFLPQTGPLVSSVLWTSLVVSLLESFGLNSKHETRKRGNL